jgi:hypothetical protein
MLKRHFLVMVLSAFLINARSARRCFVVHFTQPYELSNFKLPEPIELVEQELDGRSYRLS